MTHSKEQIVPSPLGMQLYETIDITSPSLGTNLFVNHNHIPISHEPCFSGARVDVYETAIHLRRYIFSIRSSFICDYKNDVHNNGAKCWKKRYQRAPPCDLDWYLDVLVKHTTVDSASDCLSRRRIAKMIYFKLWVLEFNKVNLCAHVLPIA
jgi:hypothetical protein